MFYEVLNSKRFTVASKLSSLKNKFYLAGGTGLALQIGHRKSDDFDFFTDAKLNNEELIHDLELILPSYKFSVIQHENDTLTLLLNDEIKLSFFSPGYKNILPLIDSPEFSLASVPEIGVMKILALLRATYRDYVDLYFILHKHSLNELIDLAKKKHPGFEDSIYLKCLLSFDDVDISPISFMEGKEVKHKQVFDFIKRTTIDFIDKS